MSAREQPRRANLARVPPHDLATERQLLGAALLALPAARIVAEHGTDLYYKPTHGHIAAAVAELLNDNSQPDPSTVAALLRQQGLLDAIGGPHYLTDLVVECSNTNSADRHARTLNDYANRRRTLGLAAEIIESVYANTDPDGVIAELHRTATQAHRDTTTSWEPVNLARALAGDGDDLQPTILARTDGIAVLYPGKVHSFIGEPESGKSWLALLACTQVIANGGHVLYIDFEADDVTQVTRLLELGVNPDTILERFHYMRPDEPIHTAAGLRLTAALDAWPIDLAIVDGVAEALALNGWDENKASDVTNLYVRLCRPLTATGAAVATIDHVVKDKEAQGRYARGSTAKLAAIDGAVYKLDTYKPFGRGLDGAAKVTVNKDRHGHIRHVATGGRLLGELHVDSTTYLNVSLHPPTTDGGETWKPTGYMAKVSRAIEGLEDVPANTVATLVGGKKKYVLEALSQLVEDGYVTTRPGQRNSVLHTLAKPYQDPSTSDIPSDPRGGK